MDQTFQVTDDHAETLTTLAAAKGGCPQARDRILVPLEPLLQTLAAKHRRPGETRPDAYTRIWLAAAGCLRAYTPSVGPLAPYVRTSAGYRVRRRTTADPHDPPFFSRPNKSVSWAQRLDYEDSLPSGRQSTPADTAAARDQWAAAADKLAGWAKTAPTPQNQLARRVAGRLFLLHCLESRSPKELLPHYSRLTGRQEPERLALKSVRRYLRQAKALLRRDP